MTEFETETEAEALASSARLFGRLLLHELTIEVLEELRDPEVAAALAELGVAVPSASTRAELDELAAEFHACLLQPAEGGPLVQSLWTGGSYQGDPAVTVAKLADVASLDFDAAASRGAEPDHLGSLLLLWAETRSFAPEVAERVASDHLRWALAPLARLASQGGFYGQLAGAVGRWIEAVA